MNTFRTAQRVYSALKDDDQAYSDFVQERRELARNIALDGAYGFQITSATVNGQSFSGSNTITFNQRLALLDIIVKMFEQGRSIAGRQTPIF